MVTLIKTKTKTRCERLTVLESSVFWLFMFLSWDLTVFITLCFFLDTGWSYAVHIFWLDHHFFKFACMYVSVNTQVQIVSLDEESSEFTSKSTFDHPYPTTKIMWIPDSVSASAYILFLVGLTAGKCDHHVLHYTYTQCNLQSVFYPIPQKTSAACSL